MPDTLEIQLQSTEENNDYTFEIRLRIVAYLSGNEYFEKNTVVFDCDPIGSNYQKTYLEANFPDQHTLQQIYEFLRRHLMKEDNIRRSIEVPLEGGSSTLVSLDGERNTTENLSEVRIDAKGETISFGPLPRMSPSIRIYESAVEGERQERRNGERLLSFFDELAPEEDTSAALPLHDGELVDRCLPLFQDERYEESARLAGQIIEERVSESVPDSFDERNGADLLHNALPPDGPIQISQESGEQNGLMKMFAGTYQAVRNPLSHESRVEEDDSRYLAQLDRTQARNILHTVDFLLTTLERYHGE